MSKFLKFALLAVCCLVGARSFAVTNAVVGACYPGTQFSTIQSAINAASPSSTVRVCYGVYAEQLVIAKPLTLLGYSNQTQVVITPPAGGVQPNVTSDLLGTVAAQVYIASPGVTLNNIALDSGGGLCTTSAYEIGIFIHNGGGSVRYSAFRNGPACAGFVALYAENSTALTVTNNSLRACLTCIRVINGMDTNVNNNVFTPGDAVPLFTGIDLDGVRGATSVTYNTVIGMQIVGIRLHNVSGAMVLHNIIPEVGSPGILLDAATSSTVQYNRITNGWQAITINDHGIPGYNNVTLNTILDYNCALSVGATLNDVVSPNYIYTSSPGSCL